MHLLRLSVALHLLWLAIALHLLGLTVALHLLLRHSVAAIAHRLLAHCGLTVALHWLAVSLRRHSLRHALRRSAPASLHGLAVAAVGRLLSWLLSLRLAGLTRLLTRSAGRWGLSRRLLRLLR